MRKNNAAGTNVGGYELQLLDLTNDGGTFAGANISIIANKQPGFPLEGDGRVDVGWIAATTFVGSELQAIGTDLGVVTVDGDLGKITAGDQLDGAAAHVEAAQRGGHAGHSRARCLFARCARGDHAIGPSYERARHSE